MVFIVSIVLYTNLKKGTAEATAKKDSYFSTLGVAIKEAKNPRVALAYTAGIVSRGDLAVVSTFFALWLSIEFESLGMSKSEAQKMAALLYVAVQACAIPGALLINFFIDKFDRVLALAISMVLLLLVIYILDLLKMFKVHKCILVWAFLDWARYLPTSLPYHLLGVLHLQKQGEL